MEARAAEDGKKPDRRDIYKAEMERLHVYVPEGCTVEIDNRLVNLLPSLRLKKGHIVDGSGKRYVIGKGYKMNNVYYPSIKEFDGNEPGRQDNRTVPITAKPGKMDKIHTKYSIRKEQALKIFGKNSIGQLTDEEIDSLSRIDFKVRGYNIPQTGLCNIKRMLKEAAREERNEHGDAHAENE